MSTPTGPLVDHFLKCTGVAAIEIGADGETTVRKAVETLVADGAIAYCGTAGDVKRLAARIRRRTGDQAALVAQLHQLAEDLHICLTPHALVVERAIAAVETVDATFSQLRASGKMKGINAGFKVARAETPALRYRDYLETCRLRALEVMAKQMR